MSRVYFTDRNLGKQFPDILEAYGLTVERHHTLFPPDGSDEQWLAHCGNHGRIAVTHDQRIRYKINEREAVMIHGVAMLVLIGKLPFAKLAQNFVTTLVKIEKFLDDREPPFIAKVYCPSPKILSINPAASGAVSLWYPTKKGK